MKKLNTLLTILLLAFITGCGVNDTEPVEPFQPQWFGNWHVETVEHGTLKIGDGITTQAKIAADFVIGDTVLVDDPKDYTMELLHGLPGKVGTIFTDSTMTLDGSGADIEKTTVSSSGRVQFHKTGQGLSYEYYAVMFEITYNPLAPPTNDYVYLSTYLPDGTRYKTWKIYVAGMDSAVAHLLQY